MNILKMLRDEHRRILQEIDVITSAREGANEERDQRFSRIRDDLRRHQQVEESLIYPLIRDAGEKLLLMEAQGEHEHVERMLAEIDADSTAGEAWRGRLGRLRDCLDRHIDEEERELFPLISRMRNKEQLRTMGEEMLRIKKGSLDLKRAA